MTVLELVISLAAILWAAILFTNAIEILGESLHLRQGAVGSVLAAVGTALPETMIPVVALIGAAIAGEGAGARSASGRSSGPRFCSRRSRCSSSGRPWATGAAARTG